MKFLIIYQESNIKNTYLGRDSSFNTLEYFPNPNKRIFKGMSDYIYYGSIEDLETLVKIRFNTNLNKDELLKQRFTFTYGYKDKTLCRDIYVIVLDD